MAQIFSNFPIVMQNAIITVWYWCNMYRWELLFFIGMMVAVIFECKEMKVHFVDDKRKVI